MQPNTLSRRHPLAILARLGLFLALILALSYLLAAPAAAQPGAQWPRRPCGAARRGRELGRRRCWRCSPTAASKPAISPAGRARASSTRA